MTLRTFHRIITGGKEDPLLAGLRSRAKEYKELRGVFQKRLNTMKASFRLTREQEREVDFGIIIPADRSLQIHADKINSDPELNDLSDQILGVILSGCVEIFKVIRKEGKHIPGYDLEVFVKDPVENQEEIVMLMQGFGGYQHIHSVGEKITLEIPAREYLPKNRSLEKAIDYWLRTIREFGLWE